jgi:3-oxoacyl-[acyl-carrier-protein] synthase-3
MKAFIKHISYYLPEKVLTNKELIERFPEWSVDKVTSKVGIKQRHISDDNETASDMAVKAAEKLFKELEIDKDSIDFILLCTQSPDYFLPTSACLIQSRLGLSNSVGALDFNQGCSGYVYGLSLAKGLISAGIAKNILFLTSETYSKYIHKEDKGNLSIFGDAAAATLVSNEGFAEIGEFELGTDGGGCDNLIVRSGGARFPKSQNIIDKDEDGRIRSSNHLYMNGSNVFNFTLTRVPNLIKSLLNKCNLEKNQIDYFVFHQANKFMLNTLRKLCRIKDENFYIDMEDVGNTVSSTIPIALKRLKDKNVVKSDSKIILAGVGVGLSWGGCVLNFK